MIPLLTVIRINQFFQTNSAYLNQYEQPQVYLHSTITYFHPFHQPIDNQASIIDQQSLNSQSQLLFADKLHFNSQFMIPQDRTEKKLNISEEMGLQNQINFRLKQELPQPLQSNNPLQQGNQAPPPKQKQDPNATNFDLSKQISKLIKIYSNKQSEDELTFAQFKQLASDLYSIIQPRELTNQELDNLVNLFNQSAKDEKNVNKPPVTVIKKDELKKKATQNKGTLGFFKKK